MSQPSSKPDGPSAPAPPRVALLHPLSLACLVVLIVNDHFLKHACPSILTGKLSDFAGLLLTPLVLQAAYERLSVWQSGQSLGEQAANRVLALGILATSCGFALVELWPPAETAYAFGLAALQWPARTLWSVLHGRGLPGLSPVEATADASDLLALPMALIAWTIGQRDEHVLTRRHNLRSRNAQEFTGWLLGAALLALQLFLAPRAQAQPTDRNAESDPYRQGAYTHDGFYAAAELGVGALLLESEASVSNGFRQPISSSARGLLAPALNLALGGTLGGLVLGVRVLLSESTEPEIGTLGRSFRVSQLRVSMNEVALFTDFYPDPHGGLHFGGSVGVLTVGVGQATEILSDSQYPDSDRQSGVSVSFDGGYSHWLEQQLCLGGLLRLTLGRSSSPQGTTLLFAPQLLGTFAWH